VVSHRNGSRLESIDFRLDGALVASDVPFRVPSVSSVARLDLFTLSSSTNYWDEIEIR
jgi:hypothetical protein